MFSKITQFNLLFALLVLIVFSASLLSEIDAINSQTIISLLLFGILMFSLMGMADVVVINYMRQWFSQNLLYALVPLAALYILTIGYIVLESNEINLFRPDGTRVRADFVAYDYDKFWGGGRGVGRPPRIWFENISSPQPAEV